MNNICEHNYCCIVNIYKFMKKCWLLMWTVLWQCEHVWTTVLLSLWQCEQYMWSMSHSAPHHHRHDGHCHVCREHRRSHMFGPIGHIIPSHVQTWINTQLLPFDSIEAIAKVCNSIFNSPRPLIRESELLPFNCINC